MAVKDKLVNLEDLKVVYDETDVLKSALKQYAGIDAVEFVTVSGNKFVDGSGVIRDASGTFHITQPIAVTANKEIHFNAVGHTSNFAMISTCASDGTNISPKVWTYGAGQSYDYVYTPNTDTYIILCYNYSYPANLYVLDSLSNTGLEKALTLKVDKSGINQITAKNVKSEGMLYDLADGISILPNQKMLNYDPTTNKYFVVEDAGFYQIRIDLTKRSEIIVAPEYSWTTAQNYYIACMTDADDVKVASYVLGNTTFHDNSNIGVTSDETQITINLGKAKENYPAAKYFYIGMVYEHDYDWQLVSPIKELEWLKLNQKQIAQVKASILDPVSILLPDVIVAVQGHELNIYNKNIIICESIDKYGIEYRTENDLIACSHQYNDFISINPTTLTATGNYALRVTVFDKLTYDVLASKTTTIKVIVDTPVSNKRVIFIGDSLTEARVYPAEIQHNLSNGGIVSIGTITGNVVINNQTLTINHEGRTGWSSNDYCTKQTFNGATNAFWNPSTSKFDFAYYMANNGFSGIDLVCLNLGTNSANPYLYDTIIDEIDEMIASIHTYDPNIQVLVSLIPPSASQDGFGAAVTVGNGTTFSYDYYQRLIVEKYMENYMGENNVDVAPVYVILDTKYDFPTVETTVSARNPTPVTRQSNQVHPSVYGYLHMADVYYNTILDKLTD